MKNNNSWGTAVINNIAPTDVENPLILKTKHRELLNLYNHTRPNSAIRDEREAVEAWCLISIEAGEQIPNSLLQEIESSEWISNSWIGKLAVCLACFYAKFSKANSNPDLLHDTILVPYESFERARSALFKICIVEIEANIENYLATGKVDLCKIPSDFQAFQGCNLLQFRRTLEILEILGGIHFEDRSLNGSNEAQFFLGQICALDMGWLEDSHVGGFIPASFSLGVSALDPNNPLRADPYLAAVSIESTTWYVDNFPCSYARTSDIPTETDVSTLICLIEQADEYLKSNYAQNNRELEEKLWSKNEEYLDERVVSIFGKPSWGGQFDDIERQYFAARRCQLRVQLATVIERKEFEASLVIEVGKLLERFVYRCHQQFKPKEFNSILKENVDPAVWESLCSHIPNHHIKKCLHSFDRQKQIKTLRNDIWKPVWTIHTRDKDTIKCEGKFLCWVLACVIDSVEVKNHPFRYVFDSQFSYKELQDLWHKRNNYAHAPGTRYRTENAHQLVPWAGVVLDWFDRAIAIMADKLRESVASQ